MLIFYIARGSSTLSVFSTAVEENQTLGPVSLPMEEDESQAEDSMIVEQAALSETGEAHGSMEVDVIDEDEIDASLTKPSSDIAPSLPFALRSEDKAHTIPPDNIIKEENGRLILEKLDTPATRKEGARRKKQERDQRKKEEKRLATGQGTLSGLDAPSAVSNVDLHASATSGAGPSRFPNQGSKGDMDAEIEAGSELSELSEVGSEDVRDRAPRRKPLKRSRVQPSRSTRSRVSSALEPGAIVDKDGATLEGGTLGMS